ncbi:SDR family NAD(P)-dependent oxidoreductase [Microbacterium sp. ASV49]|uniref:SDR family oxidoreductase n=1 Tax=Microbacterium candidum TaxID=3041922 RepID=A0ABT7MY16_9MICO|nr:SDR family oxidoreductase [Microbacterium sp. ASV49]MDL9979320.1 SDR family oxidoreductase [Microbacterium sp. ASV49]
MTDTRSHTIVTGGSSGIGAAVVADLVAHGHRVTVFDLAPVGAADGDVGYERVDVTDEQQVVDAVSRAEARAGRITGVVACHGIRGAYAPALDIDLAALRRLYDIHVVGAFAVCREVVRRLEGEPASIVLVSSTTAYRGWANQIDYGPAKAAVRQLTENLAIEWAPLGVRVNAVAPGHTLTPMVQDMIDRGYDASAVTARTPLGRMARPDETAGMIRMLLDEASFVTGQCLAVDGGWTAVGK